jgi:hypothetical protein
MDERTGGVGTLRGGEGRVGDEGAAALGHAAEPAQRLHRQAGQHFEDDVVRQRDRDLVGIDLLLDRFFAVLELAPGRKETGKQLPESPHVGCDGACLLAMMHELEISEAPAPRRLRIYSYMAGSESVD